MNLRDACKASPTGRAIRYFGERIASPHGWIYKAPPNSSEGSLSKEDALALDWEPEIPPVPPQPVPVFITEHEIEIMRKLIDYFERMRQGHDSAR